MDTLFAKCRRDGSTLSMDSITLDDNKLADLGEVMMTSLDGTITMLEDTPDGYLNLNFLGERHAKAGIQPAHISVSMICSQIQGSRYIFYEMA